MDESAELSERKDTMTIDEAIEHCENVAKTMLEIGIDKKCIQCGKEHLQLAMWLKELKEYKRLKTSKKRTRNSNKISKKV